MSIPTDTLFSQQWHLLNMVAGEYDLNVTSVWDEFTGRGVKVMVIDDGFDHAHPDLLPNYDTANDHDYGNDDANAAPFYTSDNHGTAVMGLIGAANNGTGAVGVAYNSTLIGARIDYNLNANDWTTNLIGALRDAVDLDVGVVNMSFGGAGDFDSYDGAANIARFHKALDYAVSEGRDGLGLALVKSAGNFRTSLTDVNHNQADNDSRHILVAAVDRNGYVSSYSSYGAPVLVSGFGSQFEVVTTDRLGADGYDAGDFTFDFSGTSAAAPMVSGIVALMLEANDQLGWRDIQSILAASARHVGSNVDGSSLAGSELNPWNWNGAANWNGGGMHYSEDYGYGLVDALAAVRMAESWTDQSTSANERLVTADLLDRRVIIPDGDLNGKLFSDRLTGKLVVERVTVTLDLDVANTADLRVFLIGPEGHRQRLIADAQAWTYDGKYTFHSQAFRGEMSNGDWKVRIVDDAFGYQTAVSDVKVRAYGSKPTANDTYLYTNEFSDFLGSHSNNLNDRDGGRDLMNAAAVTGAMTVDLAAGTALVDGVSMLVKGIESVFGGDGDDLLTGNNAANLIAGGRGQDTLAGGRAGDRFIFRVVADSRDGVTHDLIADFGIGADIIDLGDIDTRTRKGDQDFTYIGARNFHNVAGEVHFVRVDNAGTNDDYTLVEADLDGDGAADLQIELSGLLALAKSDFIL
ncbi:S8 family serine peptidase [Rhizobium sp. KVB221]|uniref:S8 family serine peptidase n=1 Tax=Rhizobium setariae TaxID=2801340 RepID=A0A937CKX4_9HYPH|nr:S8 family serine peptidase [Rhizobium setariae]MBL0370956.1 S8 family serine peptidase [Rhizobium setariae]